MLYCLVLVGLLFIFALSCSKAFLYFQPLLESPLSGNISGTYTMSQLHLPISESTCPHPYGEIWTMAMFVYRWPWYAATWNAMWQTRRSQGPRGRVVVAASWNSHIPKKIGLKRKILSLIRLSFPMIFLCIVKVNYDATQKYFSDFTQWRFELCMYMGARLGWGYFLILVGTICHAKLKDSLGFLSSSFRTLGKCWDFFSWWSTGV